MRQVVGLGAAAGQVKSRPSELAGRKARRAWPWAEWMDGKKKQVPRCARNDNSRAFGRAVRRAEGQGVIVGPDQALQGAEPGVVRVWGRAGRWRRGCGCR